MDNYEEMMLGFIKNDMSANEDDYNELVEIAEMLGYL